LSGFFTGCPEVVFALGLFALAGGRLRVRMAQSAA
jgi:hypothetical protein